MKVNKVCFFLGHPAHFHLFKNVINNLNNKGIEVTIFISEKDILKNLLTQNDLRHITIAGTKSNNTTFAKLAKLIKSSIILSKHIKKIKPDLLIGCLSQLAYIGTLLKIPTVFNAEDDFSYTFLQGIITFPFVNHILTPGATNPGIFKYKRISYKGYHKLAYLHPKQFQPDRTKVKIPVDERFFILRLANLNAYHDINAKGLTDHIAGKLIALLRSKGRVLITSERELPPEFEKYRFTGDIQDIHHYLYYASLFIGDSQSMAVESAVLGTPNIRFNSFARKINVLNELEDDYNLTKGIHSKAPDELFQEVESILNNNQISEIYKKRREKLISEKIDVTGYFEWFIENYPESVKLNKGNPNLQDRFH